MNRFEGDQAELCEELRREFQIRVGDLCVTDPFCFSIEEMQSLLTKISPSLLLQAFSAVHSQLLKLRDQLVFTDQDHVVQMTHNAISKVVADDARFRSHRDATQKHDFSITYQEERLAKRKAKYDAQRKETVA
jgi:hypothetical protein